MAPQSLPDLQHAAGGLRAVIDPVTLDKVAEGDRAGMTPGTHPEALSQSLDGLTVVLRPDGSKYLDLQGRFRCGVVAGIGGDGARQYCVSSGAQADAALRQTATPQIAPEVK
jgi:hypothetical protein